MPTPPGQHDYSRLRLSRHALERFVERFVPDHPESAEPALRETLERCRRLGRNPSNGAFAALALHGDRLLVAIVQDDTVTTVLTWPQFEPVLPEFGRPRLPRKRGRMLRRLRSDASAAEPPRRPDSRASGVDDQIDRLGQMLGDG